MFEEVSFISQFDVKSDLRIGIRKTNQVIKDGKIIAENYWRTVLEKNDSNASQVLNEPFYLDLANYIWSK